MCHVFHLEVTNILENASFCAFDLLFMVCDATSMFYSCLDVTGRTKHLLCCLDHKHIKITVGLTGETSRVDTVSSEGSGWPEVRFFGVLWSAASSLDPCDEETVITAPNLQQAATYGLKKRQK